MSATVDLKYYHYTNFNSLMLILDSKKIKASGCAERDAEQLHPKSVKGVYMCTLTPGEHTDDELFDNTYGPGTSPGKSHDDVRYFIKLPASFIATDGVMCSFKRARGICFLEGDIHLKNFSIGKRTDRRIEWELGEESLENIIYQLESLGIVSMQQDERKQVDAGPLFTKDDPWRKGLQDYSEKALEKLKNFGGEYEPLKVIPVKHARILMAGPIGAGKSSFFNTINSIYRGYVTSQAATGTDPDSLTTRHRTYETRYGREGHVMNFRLCDTMGLEEAGQGLNITDFDYLLGGYVPDDFDFKAGEQLDVTKEVELKDKIHVLAIVINAVNVDFIGESLQRKLTQIKQQAVNRDIPIVVLLTHVDMVCKEVKADITNVYHSRAVYKCVEKASKIMGIAPSQVIPVKNYETETELEKGVDIVALYALRQLIRLADDFFDTQMLGEAKKPDEKAESLAQNREMMSSNAEHMGRVNGSDGVTEDDRLPHATDRKMTPSNNGDVGCVEGRDGVMTEAEKLANEMRHHLQQYLGEAALKQYKQLHRQRPDVVIAGLDLKIRGRLAGLLSVSARNQGGLEKLVDMLPNCGTGVIEGKTGKEAGIRILEWMANRGYTVDHLGIIFMSFRIHTDIGSIIQDMALPDGLEDHHGDSTATSLDRDACALSEMTAGSTPYPLPPDANTPQGGEGVGWRKMAAAISEIPGVVIKTLRYYKDEMVVYCDLDENKYQSAREQLHQRAKDFTSKPLRINETDCPSVNPCCGPKIGIGGTITSIDTEDSARVAGYLSDGCARTYAATVAHLFQDTPAMDDDDAEDCLIFEYGDKDQHYAKCVAKTGNVGKKRIFVSFDKTVFYDICFVKAPLPLKYITNAFKVRGDGELGIDPRLTPYLLPNRGDEIQNGMDVYVCNVARKGVASKGIIDYIQVNEEGILILFAIRPLFAGNNPMTKESDSGCLVTKTTLVNTGPVPNIQLDPMEAIGIVVGVDENGTTVALPFWPQLVKLCSDHDILRDKVDGLVFLD